MIYLKNVSENIKTVEDVLDNLFKYSKSTSTYSTVTTYSDKECKIVQCVEDCNRSFEDIVELVNTYLPNISEKEIIIKTIDYCFLKLIDTGKSVIKRYEHYVKTNEDRRFGFSYCFAILRCPGIKKVVISPNWNASGIYTVKNTPFIKSGELPEELDLLLTYESYKEYKETDYFKTDSKYSLHYIIETYKNK